jgi:hypothetical protein
MNGQSVNAKPHAGLRRLAKFAAAVTLLAASMAMLAIQNAGAATGVVADVKATWGDTNLPPGGEGVFAIQARDVGSEDLEPGLKITDELPAGVTATSINWGPSTAWEECNKFGWELCEALFGVSPNCTGIDTETITCELTVMDVLLFGQGRALGDGASYYEETGYLPTLYVEVAVSPSVDETGTNTVSVEGGGAAPSTDIDHVPLNPTPSPFGVVPGSFESDVFGEAYPGVDRSRQAGDHPFELRVNFDLNAGSTVSPRDGSREAYSNGLVRTVEVTLPRGVIGNPEALPKCDPVVFAQVGVTPNSTACPPNTQVGYLNIPMLERGERNGRGCCFINTNSFLSRVPIYNLKPPRGTPVDLAFNAGGFVQGHIYAELDPAQNYAIKSVTPNISALVNVRGSEVTLWGVPGDPSHDKFRYVTSRSENSAPILGAPFTAPIRPFFTDPMDCGFDNGSAKIRTDSYEHPNDFTTVREDGHAADVEGCGDPRFRFEPEVALQPTDRHAGAPTGLDVHLKVPLRNDEVDEAAQLYAKNGFVKGISTPPMKKAVVTFPEGMTISPSAAQGLGSCTSQEIGMGTDKPVTCPDSSQYGTLTLHTPILPINEQPEGFIYIAKQGDNPFHNFLSIYLVVEEPERGILVKIPGRIDLDPDTGQITTTFDDLPQFPVSDMQMTFKGGVRGALVNPTTCGTKTIRAEFFSWHDPGTAHVVNSSYDITEKPNGSPCSGSLAARPFAPQMTAGTLNPEAGGYSPFTLHLTRSDDDQEFSQLGVSLPEGLSAKIAGVSDCPEAGIAQAISRTGAGQGALEQADPSCPASSQIGTTQVGVGVGVPLTFVPGKVYLAGPYRGAPLSMVVISPAIVGPYDLGVIAVRAALRVNPETTEVSVESDPFPLIYQGIPVRIRDIRVNVDRPETTLNPTSCAEKAIAARVTGTGGDLGSTADDTAAHLSARFQASDCSSLGFQPQLNLRLFGGTHRGSHPKLRAVLRMPPGGANIGSASVALPGSEFLDQGHIRTVCTRTQFGADQCPAASVYGHVVAKTPLLDEPLSGPVYLRSSSHKLPDLVAALHGRIDVDVVGRIDSVHGGIRNTFELVPDAPVSSFVLTMQGGKKGLLVNSKGLCEGAGRGIAAFDGQNGMAVTLHPKLGSACGKETRRHRRNGHGHRPNVRLGPRSR